MKIILISGSRSNVGKSTLSLNIAEILKDYKVEIIKFGHGKINLKKKIKLFNNIEIGKKYIDKKKKNRNLNYLIIEGNSIVKHIQFDLLIFIKDKIQKKSSEYPLEHADIVIDENYKEENIKKILKIKKIKKEIINAFNKQYRYIIEKKGGEK